MRHIRFYKTERDACRVEQELAPAAGIAQVFLYKCRDHELFMATDEDHSSFLRHRQAGIMYNAVYWTTLEIDPSLPRIYFCTTKMYSTEQQILQSRLAVGILNAIHAHIYRFEDDEGPVFYVVDQYRGQCLPVGHKDTVMVAEYYTTFGQMKLPGKMS